MSCASDQGDLEEAEVSKQQVVGCQRDMLKHTGDLSLVAAGTFGTCLHVASTPPAAVVRVVYRRPRDEFCPPPFFPHTTARVLK